MPPSWNYLDFWNAMWHFIHTLEKIRHQQERLPPSRNGSVRVDGRRQRCQRHPRGELLCVWSQHHVSHCILPSDHSLTFSSRSVGLLFWINTLSLWLSMTICQNGFIGYTLESWLQCDGWRSENLCSHSLYLCAKCHSVSTNYTYHFDWPNLCGYWQSITRSVCLLSYCL